jgi:7,8-dihydropterin-6-yl-methyl-4-(beta-D-ribofuranosyl)aminobenzene 5'-phosphate synthase
MKITIIYDNTAYKEKLQADWGFSAVVETTERTILFDTGTKASLLMGNMRKLDIDPSVVDDVFISHNHFDHTGGLSAFLNENSSVNIFLPPSLKGVHGAKEVIKVNKPLKIYDNIYSTGELDDIEQAMAVKIDKGLIIIVGCSHPEMRHILDTASQFGCIYGIVGGLHGFNHFELFKNLKLICPTHCTRHIKEIKKLYPDQYVEGGAGRVIEI